MCPPSRRNRVYRRLAQLYRELCPKENKTKQTAQVDYIWSKVETDDKKSQLVITVLSIESKKRKQADYKPDTSPIKQLKKSDAELYKHLVDARIIDDKKVKITSKPKATIGDSYRTGERLAKGGYGVVYHGTRIADGHPVAIKIVKKTKITNWKPYNDHDVPIEAFLHLKLGSLDGVLKMLDYYEMSNTCVFVFETPVEGIDLFEFITREERLSEPLSRHFLTQITDTLIECQSQQVLHRDIKDENIIVDLVRHEVKLIDFGSGAMVQDDKYKDFCSTRCNAPPEYIRDCWYYGESITVWTLGCLLFSMVTGNIPFNNDDQVLAGDIKFQKEHEVTDHCQHLIKWCLAASHTGRPTLSQIQQHAWMNLPY